MEWRFMRLRDISIKRKVIMIVMVTALSALLLTTIANIGSQTMSARRQWQEDMLGTAAMLAEACDAAISFDDRRSAVDRLATLRAKSWISAAHVYRSNGELFAKYLAHGAEEVEQGNISDKLLAQKDPVFLQDGDYAHCWAPIVLEGESLGVIHLAASIDPLMAVVRRQVTSAVVAVLIASLIALVFASRLQRFISMPVLNMLETMDEVRREGNYGARAKSWGNDELGRLTGGLNGMLGQIETHVKERARYSERLEKEVAQRTTDLTAAKDRAETASAINEARDARLQVQNDALATLVANPTLHGGDLVLASRLLNGSGAQTLGVERASIWLFSEDRSELRCIDLYESSLKQHSSGQTIQAADHAQYFEALKAYRSIVASDVASDPRTQSLRSSYAEPLGIGALLDSGVRRGGEIVGVLCFEHLGEPRKWAQDEQNFAGSLADLIGVALEACERCQAQAELVAARDAANAANAAKSQFLANMSHEIRTPINGVMGMMQLLSKGDLTGRQHRFIDMALSSAKTLMAVIGDVLDFSKVEAGHMELAKEEFVLRQTLDGAIRIFAEQAESKGIELSYSVAPDLPDRLIGDPDRLCQIVINLVSNSLKFTSEGEINVDVRLGCVSGRQASLECAVRDTGPGIPEEQREKIFASFAQADSSMRRRHGGTGLGLAISRHLVSLMGGEIWVDSELGHGSTFHFTANLDLPEQMALPEMGRLDLHGEIKALLVDAPGSARNVASSYLQSWGFALRELDGSAEAIEELQRAEKAGEPYRLVIVDSTLEDADGCDLARMIKGNVSIPGLRVILLSGFEMPSDGVIEECGVQAVVAKPVCASELYDAVIHSIHETAGTGKEWQTATAAEKPKLASASILLVEDNVINQEVAREMITHFGHSCVCVDSGEKALEVIARESFDLILMDCQMPVMDGYQATAAIREWEERAGRAEKTPIIALTAHAMKGDRERCLEAGMDDYLSKPLQFNELSVILEKWVGCRRVVAGPGAAQREGELEEAVIASCNGKRTLAKQMIDLFTNQSKNDIEEIKKSMTEGDHGRMHYLAHRLKGAAGTLGLVKLSQAAEGLVRLARNGQTSGAEQYVAVLCRETERVSRINTVGESL